MVYFGEAEARNLHGLTLVPVMPKSVAMRQSRSWWFLTFCTGGRNPKDPHNPLDNQEPSMMVFFRDVVATALNKPWVKFLVILTFLVYLGFGIYGCTLVKEGLDRRKLSRDDSYSVRYYDYEDRFFREYPYRVQVVINQTMNYADPEVQERIERILTRFESSKYIAGPGLTESWLRTYLSFIRQQDSFLFLQSLNMSNQDDFQTGLQSVFLKLPMTDSFRHDLVWNEDETEITATRFVIQTHNIKDANMEKEMLLELRAIADEFKQDNVTIFNHLFIFFDQFILVREISLQTISVAALVMMAISVFFIPSISCAVWVAFSIISIEIGVVGYMTHWGVNLDSISMINLIMCIGFSVDFSAHISYAYISCGESTPAARVRTSLYSLGMPIYQGSVSTILGIVALAFAPSYVFITFFKTVFLVMLFGATHGVLLLPVLLSLTDGCFGGNRSRASVKSSGSDASIVAAVEEGGSGKRPHHQLPHQFAALTRSSSAGGKSALAAQFLPSPISHSLPGSDRKMTTNYHVNPSFLHDDSDYAAQQVSMPRMIAGSAPGAPIYIPRVALQDCSSGAGTMPSSSSSSDLTDKFLKYSSNWIGVQEASDSGQETKTSSSSSASSLEGVDLGIGTSGEEFSEHLSDKGVKGDNKKEGGGKKKTSHSSDSQAGKPEPQSPVVVAHQQQHHHHRRGHTHHAPSSRRPAPEETTRVRRH